MADDLEAFLRQAAQRRAQRAASPPLRPAAAPSTPAPPRAPLAPPPSRPAPAKPVVAKVVSAPETTRLGTRVNTAEFAQRAEHLGEEVGLADEHMEAHLAHKFDHHVGSKALSEPAEPAASSDEPSLDPEALAAMLANPTSLRHAVLLSEILARPDFD